MKTTRKIKNTTLMYVGTAVVFFYLGFVLGHSFSSPSSVDVVSRNQPAHCIFIEKEFTVTAYCPCKLCCGKWADGYTSSGLKIQLGMKFVAAPKEYPFGTIMEIPSYGKISVEDRGGVIKGNKLDVFFDTHEEALQWGVQYLKVKIYESKAEVVRW